MTDASATLTDRELDAWLAEHLFGWRWVQSSDPRKSGVFLVPGDIASRYQPADGPTTGDLPSYWPHYSSTYKGMGQVLEAMRERGWWYLIGTAGDDLRSAEFSQFRDGEQLQFISSAASLPRAVAEAARAALEAEA